MWLYVNNNLVIATNQNNMTGNTGWVECNSEIAEPLFDEYGVPMYAYEDGVIRERTAEERAADRPLQTLNPSDAERLDALESAFAEFVEVMICG